MKKSLLAVLVTSLVLFTMVGLASATTLGNALVKRDTLDTWTNFTMIDFSLQFTDSGRIDSWSIYSQRPGYDVYLQTFRLVDGLTYEIVGENKVYVDASGIINFDIAGPQEIQYQAGDYIGWTFTDSSVFGFGRTGNPVDSVMWSSASGVHMTGVGNQITFNGVLDPREYSIAANLAAPVPEPATIILFGAGLVGLGLYRRKSNK